MFVPVYTCLHPPAGKEAASRIDIVTEWNKESDDEIPLEK
jgi:hypothetical protein